MTTFPPPVFTVPDAQQAEQDLQTEYTNITGKQLLEAQPETLLANWAAYLKTVEDTNIQFTGEQCLVNFAIDQNLDQLGAFWDAPRLPAEPAITTLEFTLTGVQPTNVFIPQGTRVRTDDRLFVFATNEQIIINSGDTTGTVLATATTTGVEGNGYAIDTITELVDLISLVGSVTNTTASSSGANIETDSDYRARLLLAPNKVTVAGTIDQYKFLAFSVDSNIIDVGIESPTGGKRLADTQAKGLELSQEILDYLATQGVDTLTVTAEDIAPLTYESIAIPRYTVDIYILSDDGNPSQDLIDKVQTFFDNPSNRPLTDVPRVFAPEVKDLNISVAVVALEGADTSTLQTRLDTALAEYVTEIETQLGFDVVPSQIIDRLFIQEETYSVTVLNPANTVPIEFNERPNIITQSVTITGVSER